MAIKRIVINGKRLLGWLSLSGSKRLLLYPCCSSLLNMEKGVVSPSST